MEVGGLRHPRVVTDNRGPHKYTAVRRKSIPGGAETLLVPGDMSSRDKVRRGGAQAQRWDQLHKPTRGRSREDNTAPGEAPGAGCHGANSLVSPLVLASSLPWSSDRSGQPTGSGERTRSFTAGTTGGAVFQSGTPCSGFPAG